MSIKDKIFSFYTSPNTSVYTGANFFWIMKGREHYPYYGDDLNQDVNLLTYSVVRGHTTIKQDAYMSAEILLLDSWLQPLQVTYYAAKFLTSLLAYPYFAATMGMSDSGGVVANPASQFASSVYSLLANNPVSFLGYIAAKTINTGIVAIRTKIQENRAKKEEALEQSDFAHFDKPELTEGKVRTIAKTAPAEGIQKSPEPSSKAPAVRNNLRLYASPSERLRTAVNDSPHSEPARYQQKYEHKGVSA